MLQVMRRALNSHWPGALVIYQHGRMPNREGEFYMLKSSEVADLKPATLRSGTSNNKPLPEESTPTDEFIYVRAASDEIAFKEEHNYVRTRDGGDVYTGSERVRKVILWEKNYLHEGGEVFISGDLVIKCYPTPKIKELIRNEILIKVDKDGRPV
jgi:hypothetical protein